MTPITAVAEKFFEACETGKGWEGCRQYCHPDATFSAQAEPLAEMRTLHEYADWMRDLLTYVSIGIFTCVLWQRPIMRFRPSRNEARGSGPVPG